MHKHDIQKMILSELQEIKRDMKEVRQHDIPNLHTIVTKLKAEMDHVKEKASVKSTFIAAVGGLIAVVTSLAIAYYK